MVQKAQQYVWTAPTVVIIPGAVTTLVVLAYKEN